MDAHIVLVERNCKGILGCFSQCIMEFIMKPRAAYKNLKNKIDAACIYYADVITNPFMVNQEEAKEAFDWFQNSKYNEASNELSRLASEASIYTPKYKEAKETGKLLMFLSHNMWRYDNSPRDGSENYEKLERLKQIVRGKK